MAGALAAFVWTAPGVAAPSPVTQAAPAISPAAPLPMQAATEAPVQLAHWAGGRRHFHGGRRGYRDYRRDRRRDRRRTRRALGIGAAVVGGAIIANEIARSRSQRRYVEPPRSSNYDRHVDWCYRRYRSYRASDNTFQPYNGGRRECYSPHY